MKDQKKIVCLQLLFLLLSFSGYAQIKGVIKDSISGSPIAYVNIWVENENIGTTSEENGEFRINVTVKNKNLIFSTLGFEKKIIKSSEAQVVKLKPIAYQLKEVVISNRKETKEIEIGKTNNEIYQAFDNGPRIDAKFFPYYSAYKKTKYIKKVTIYADSRIENATIKIHFYNVDPNGMPSEEILGKNYIVSVKKGVKKNKFDLSELNLKMPQNGIYVAFEKLMIEKNKVEKTFTDLNTNISQTQKTYFPLVLYNFVEREFSFTFSGGKWIKKTKNDTNDLSGKMMVNEPVINLILTN